MIIVIPPEGKKGEIPWSLEKPESPFFAPERKCIQSLGMCISVLAKPVETCVSSPWIPAEISLGPWTGLLRRQTHGKVF